MAEPHHIGKYEILEELGRGGFAVVYKARDTKLDRIVALKVLKPYLSDDPTFVARFRQEARAIANLRHANIVTVHDAGQTSGQLYIAMEYVPGQTLQTLLEARGALPLEEALPILEQIAQALDYAHEQGVIHRDVKPANILIEETRQGLAVKLMDFGLVRAMESNTALTSQGALLGTPEYMAPEQADPNRAAEIGPAADRYALGIVAYQLLTGRVPFPGNTPATLNAHENKPVPPPRSLRLDLPLAVETALLKMLSKSPGSRFDSAEAFVTRLHSGLYLSGLGGQTKEQGQRGNAASRRLFLPVWTCAALGAALLGIVLLILAVVYLPKMLAVALVTPSTTQTPTITLTRRLSTATPSATLTPSPIPTSSTYTPTPQPPTATPTLAPGAITTRAIDGMVMVYVPAGEFLMGSASSDYASNDEKPQHKVYLDAFWIDSTEVTNAQYNACVQSGKCQASSYANNPNYNHKDQPVVGVDWENARLYCEWMGGALPTEAQWEKTAGWDWEIGAKRLYPWGSDRPAANLANFCDKHCDNSWKDSLIDDGYTLTAPVGSYPDGASLYGALDMAGNVWEWVSDWYGPYSAEAQINPTGPNAGVYRVLRGGGWDDNSTLIRTTYRFRGLVGYRDELVGFRCVVAEPPE